MAPVSPLPMLLKSYQKQINQCDEDPPQNFEVKDEDDINIYTVLPVYDKKWYRIRHYQKLMWIIFIVSLTSCNTGYDSSLLNSLYTEKDFMNAIGNVKGSILGALTSGYFFGCFLSFFFSAKVNDKFGRKKLSNILQCCHDNWGFDPVSCRCLEN